MIRKISGNPTMNNLSLQLYGHARKDPISQMYSLQLQLTTTAP